MVNKYTRRQFMKTLFRGGAATAGAYAGYNLAKGVASLVPLESVVNELYGTAYDTLREVQGAAEDKLVDSVKNVQKYIGETAEEGRKTQELWEKTGLLGKDQYKELHNLLSNAERYVKEADFPERMKRLKDRLENRLIEVDQKVESKLPGPLRKFNDWFSKSVKGDQRGSREALEKYRSRLDSLVKVYDANSDNIVAQADLLDETGGTFKKAQNKIVEQAKVYIADPKIENEEKDLYRGLIEMSKSDPSGKELADYLLKTKGYFRLVDTIDGFDKLNKEITERMKDVKSLQGLVDEGLKLKDRLREANEKELPRLQAEATNYQQRFETERETLKQKGYDINYDLYPKLTAAKDAALGVVGFPKNLAGYAGAAVGGVGAYWLSGLVTGFGDRRAFKKTAKALEAAEAQNVELRAKLTAGDSGKTAPGREVSKAYISDHAYTGGEGNMTIKDCTMIEAPTCKDSDSVVEVAKVIRKHLLRYIYVLDSKGKPVGVISTTDMNNRVVAEGKDPKSIKAKDIMTSPVYSLKENIDEKEAYRECAKNDVAACPVVDKDGKIKGVITIHEILRKLTKVE